MAGLELIFADEDCARALTDERLLAAMARFEGALARACASEGLIAPDHGEIISRVCETAHFDAGALAGAARREGTLAIPFVTRLRAQVAAVSGAAAQEVHFGATSQDVIDTGMVLCLRPAADRIDALAVQLGNTLAALAERHS